MRVRDATSEVAPTAANTVVLFNSFLQFLGIPADVHDLVRHIVTLAHDQAGTRRLVWSQTGSGSPTTWDVVYSVAVAAPSAPLTVSGPHDLAVDGLRHYGILWINGGVTQGTWRIDQETVERERGPQS